MNPSDPILSLALPSGERLTLSRHGAQVLEWRGADGEPVLYLSPVAPASGGAHRGGVPVCFPQFSGRGPLPKHGFARSSVWQEQADAALGTLSLRLQHSPESLALWPHRFEVDLQVRLEAETLRVNLRVRNTGAQPWSFTGALHTYLRVDDVATTKVHGLTGLTYEDALDDCRLKVAQEAVPDLSGPIDRVYRGASAPLTVRSGSRQLQVTQTGFEDVVVWNPGAVGTAALRDLPAGDHRHMLCVEAAQAARPVMVAAGDTWEGSQTLRLLAT